MLILQIDNLPVLPRNRSHMLTTIKKGGRVIPMNIKTPLCREFEKDLMHRLSYFKNELEDFKSKYNPKLHYISLQMFVFTPKELLLTKDGHISSRSTDADSNKAQMDVLFECLGLDDKTVRDYHVITPISHDGNYNHLIKLKLENLWALEQDYDFQVL
jgi:hypothetical protein